MKTIGKYEICGLLGKGGMGSVYKVRLPVIGNIVALKLLSPHPNLISLLGENKIRELFKTEALTMAGLRHPNIVAVWDFNDSRELTYFVMEYYCNNLGIIIGESYLLENPSRIISVDKSIHYTRQIIVGLSRLHQSGIIHRDIKPYNILLTDEDNIKISDFGLSKLRGETFHGPSNLKVGSPYYAAPEQEADPNQVDHRADIYPVGVMLYRMLTGQLPIDAFKKPSECNPDLDSYWDEFILKAISQKRDKRFASTKEMLKAFDELILMWEEKKEKACMAPVELLSNKTLPEDSIQTLRTKSIKENTKNARALFSLNSLWRPAKYITNDFKNNLNGTVTDKNTGLIWQQDGSDYPMTWHEAHEYIEKLNLECFADICTWRLPTVDELISLLTEVPKAGDLCIEPLFDQNKKCLWSSDRRSFVAAWYVSLDVVFVWWQDFTCYYFVRAVSSIKSL
jgi:serine/threonine protein kinase